MKDKKILIVDDSEFDRSLLMRALSKKGGFITLEADSGDRCLAVLKDEKIDLVLMDIMMPGVHGTDVLSQIREKFNAVELPIIMATSKIETSVIVECLQKGANDYITKPFNFDVAISRISTHLMLADVSREMSRLKEVAALDALITTYNHEINNPLTIALGCLNKSLLKDEAALEKLKTSLWRVADIVQKIREITDKKEVDYGEYVGTSKMIKVK